MTYAAVIRVAQIKTGIRRLDHVRKGSGAKGEQPVIVTEFLKPGLDEFSSLLPAFIARPLLDWAERTGRRDKFNVGLHIRTNTIFGFALLRMMAAFKPLRRRGYRYGAEQALIERWLLAIVRALPHDTVFAREIAETARLIKGYSDTHRRGTRNFQRLFDAIVDPTLAAANAGPDTYANATAALATARKAALADPEGDALDRTLLKLGRVAAA
jgi:indolepyruvate ferredoxin oxidoreductase beta subunit